MPEPTSRSSCDRGRLFFQVPRPHWRQHDRQHEQQHHGQDARQHEPRNERHVSDPRWLAALVTCAALWAVLLGGVCSASGDEPTRRPNVILIMSDDQGYGDFGFLGNPVIQTPHLDAMAARSAQVKHFYVSPVCTPTRACLMTGRYNYRTRAIDTYIGRAMMDPDEVTVAEVLREAGYATGIFGKWHLGDNYPTRPMDQGFEESLVHRGGGISQPSDPPEGHGKYTDPTLFHNGRQKSMKGYCTDIFFNEGMSWAERVSKEQPFFLYIAPNAPHGPVHDVPPDWLEHYRNLKLTGAEFPQVGHPLPEKFDADFVTRVYAMISNIDDNVGRLMAWLGKHELLEDTLVIYMLDNGPQWRRYVAGHRGAKSDVYEGGIRSPLLVHWPKRLAAGTTIDRVAAHIDLMPTILDACGVALPKDVKFDGRSLLPLFERRPTEWPDRTLFIQSHRGDLPLRYHHFAARDQRWKLVNNSGFGGQPIRGEPKFELFDMQSDSLELNDVAAQHPEIVARLKAQYDAWFDDVSSERQDNYAPPRIHLGTARENPTVLTRQDWRGPRAGWTPQSLGHWEVHVAHAGPYDVRLRLGAANGARTAALQVGDKKWQREIAAGAGGATFEGIELPQGPVVLEVRIGPPDPPIGPHQVEVERR
jgi:arylsulfatase A-like enzyme